MNAAEARRLSGMLEEVNAEIEFNSVLNQIASTASHGYTTRTFDSLRDSTIEKLHKLDYSVIKIKHSSGFSRSMDQTAFKVSW